MGYTKLQTVPPKFFEGTADGNDGGNHPSSQHEAYFVEVGRHATTIVKQKTGIPFQLDTLESCMYSNMARKFGCLHQLILETNLGRQALASFKLSPLEGS